MYKTHNKIFLQYFKSTDIQIRSISVLGKSILETDIHFLIAIKTLPLHIERKGEQLADIPRHKNFKSNNRFMESFKNATSFNLRNN